MITEKLKQACRQIWIVARLQLARVFFSRRSFWVYGLALIPSIPFLGKGIQTQMHRSARTTPAAVIQSFADGAGIDRVISAAGQPVDEDAFSAPPGVFDPPAPAGTRRPRAQRPRREDFVPYRVLYYYDGQNRWRLDFERGVLKGSSPRPLSDFAQDRTIFAAIFQHFYLRLSIFFGCLGIFINLFRGEMLDKTLHYWFLAPMSRHVLLAGKYLSGLIASAVIFTAGAILCYLLMLWPQDPAQMAEFWAANGIRHLFWYAASAALACLGYGSVFLAAGMLVRNPIIPAAVMLLWENINGILPAILQKFTVLYYVQSLAPVPPPMDANAPLLVRLLAAPAEPASPVMAVAGLLALAALVLWLAGRSARHLEINYGTD